MKFASPAFLFALFTLAIPIVIHLFSFRRFKKVMFSDVRLLREIRHEKRSGSRIRHWLVLLSRLLFLSFLVLAFARPFIPGANSSAQSSRRTISIYVDNSFSMNATGEGGRLLDLARSKAREISMAYRSADQFQLLTNDFEGRHQQLVNRETFLNLLDEVEESPASKNLNEVIARQHDLLSHEDPLAVKDIYLLSDFQQSVTTFGNITLDTLTNIFAVPLPANPASNIYVDSIWFSSPVRIPGASETIFARVKNAGSRDVENVPVQLFINDQPKAPGAVSIPAGGTRDISFAYQQPGTGIKYGRLSLQDHPVTYDDDFFFSYKLLEQVKVLVIEGKGENPFIRSFLGTENYFNTTFVTPGAIDYSSFLEHQVIIVDQLAEMSSGFISSITAFVEQGRHIVVFPDLQAGPQIIQPLSTALRSGTFGVPDTNRVRIDALDLDHEIFSDVFEKRSERTTLPQVYKSMSIRPSGVDRIVPLMTMGARGIFLGVADRGKGRAYLFAAPARLDATDFPRHALFVPVLYKIIISSQRSGTLYHSLDSEDPVLFTGTLTGKDKLVLIKSAEQNFEVAPEIVPSGGSVYLHLHQSINRAGNYVVSYDEEPVQGLSLNYSRNESDISLLTPGEIQSKADAAGLNLTLVEKPLQNLTAGIEEMNQGKPLWKYCIWLALAFLAIEVLLLRLWTNEPFRKKSTATP